MISSNKGLFVGSLSQHLFINSMNSGGAFHSASALISGLKSSLTTLRETSVPSIP